MNHTLLMGCFKSLGNLECELQGFFDGYSPTPQPIGQRVAFN